MLLAAPLIISIICLLTLHPLVAATFVRWGRRLIYGSSYQARYRCDGPESDIIRHEYSVFLYHGYSLDQHKKAVGRLLPIDEVLSGSANSYRTSYTAKLDDEMLTVVRSDLGVDLVMCNVRPQEDW